MRVDENPDTIGNLDVSSSARSVIGGSANNILLRTLKNNGYHTILLTGGSSYYTNHKGKYLDAMDISTNASILLPLVVVSHYSPRLQEMLDQLFSCENGNYHGDLFTRLKIAMQEGQASGKPCFISFKGGVQHTPSDNTYTWRDRTAWIASGSYQKLFPNANRELREITDYIIANDPGALVIMFGDHGAVTFRDIEFGGNVLSEEGDLLATCAANKIDIMDVLDDRFRVFFAWRLPHGEQADLGRGMYMNNLNVFVHVFAWLAQDESILRHRKQSVSRLANAVLMEGKLQPAQP